MSKGELLRYLKSKGFYLAKNGGKHAVWSDGRHKVRVPYGSKIDPRLCKMILLESRGRVLSSCPDVVRAGREGRIVDA